MPSEANILHGMIAGQILHKMYQKGDLYSNYFYYMKVVFEDQFDVVLHRTRLFIKFPAANCGIITTEYDGISWYTSGNAIVGKTGSGRAGSRDSALSAGGGSGCSTCTEFYNG